MPQIGENDYRDGATERLVVSRLLIEDNKFSVGVDLAGRAVEGMFRALIWKAESYRLGQKPLERKSLETGHDLRKLWKWVEKLGLSPGHEDEVRSQVQMIARRWHNNMRFVPARWVESYWRELGAVTNRNTMKYAAKEFYDACSMIIRRCEVLYGKADKS